MTSGTNIVSRAARRRHGQARRHDDRTRSRSRPRRRGGLADKVQALVDAANKVHQTIGRLTAYDPTTNTAQPLTGDSRPTQLVEQRSRPRSTTRSAATALVSPGLAGVSADKDGNFTFDQTKFLAAFDAEPDGRREAVRAGRLVDEPERHVHLGRRPTQWRHLRRHRDAARGAGERRRAHRHVADRARTRRSACSVGTTQVSYAVKATDTQADVVNGLNAAFANAGLALQATDTGSGVQIASRQLRPHREVRRRLGRHGLHHSRRHRRAGTINGVAATGSGQQLMVPFATPGSAASRSTSPGRRSATSATSPTAPGSRSG